MLGCGVDDPVRSSEPEVNGKQRRVADQMLQSFEAERRAAVNGGCNREAVDVDWRLRFSFFSFGERHEAEDSKTCSHEEATNMPWLLWKCCVQKYSCPTGL